MEFFIHSATGSYSEDLKRLVKVHGMAGLGFFWMSLEKLLLCNRPVPLADLVKKRFQWIVPYSSFQYYHPFRTVLF